MGGLLPIVSGERDPELPDDGSDDASVVRRVSGLNPMHVGELMNHQALQHGGPEGVSRHNDAELARLGPRVPHERQVRIHANLDGGPYIESGVSHETSGVLECLLGDLPRRFPVRRPRR